MKRIAKFHKVSLEQFMEGWKDTFGEQYTEDQIKALYEEIKLPKRATAGSAGYDFYAPDDFVIEPGKTIKIPTGIRVEMEENWVLKCYPRSGLGFKFRLQLNNTVGIIDSDYFYSERSQMTARKIRLSALQPVQALCRGFLLSMELLWMTMRQQSETGDLEVRRSRVIKKRR